MICHASKWMFGDFENGAELIAADKSILLAFFSAGNDSKSPMTAEPESIGPGGGHRP